MIHLQKKKNKQRYFLGIDTYGRSAFFSFFLIFSLLLSLTGKNVLQMYQLDGQEARLNTHTHYMPSPLDMMTKEIY